MSIVHGFGQITDQEALKLSEIAGKFLFFSKIAYFPYTACIGDLSQISRTLPGFLMIFGVLCIQNIFGHLKSI